MDKIGKKIIEFLFSKGKGTEYICRYDEKFENLAVELHISVEDLRAAVRWLESQGFLEYQRYGNGKVAGFHLSHQGLHWKYFRRRKIMHYIANKWTDYLAVLISLLSLIISVIALLQSPR